VLAVLRQWDFSLLWFGGVLSVIGDYFLFVAPPFFVYERTGSTLATGAMFAAEALPRLLFGILLGWSSGVIEEARLFSLSLISNGIILAVMFNTPALFVIVALGILAGMTVVGWFVMSQTLLQKWVADRFRGRVFGAYDTTQALMILAGMGLAVVLEGSLGVVVVLSIVGAAWSLAGVAAWLLLPHGK
jgi:hypothetical protein